MLSYTLGDQTFVFGLAKRIVSEIAPDEEDLFDELCDEYLADPNPPDPEVEIIEDPLSFGVNGVLVVTTPAIIAVVKVAFVFVRDIAMAAFELEGGEYAREKVKDFFEPAIPGKPSLTLTPQQADQARERVLEEAQRFDVSDKNARRIADMLFHT